MKTIVRTLMFFLIPGIPICVLAQEGRIEVDPGDKPLLIRGWVADDNSFVGNVRVTLRGIAADSKPVKLSILPSDLKRTQGAEIIGRQQVAVGGITELSPELPTTIPVKVSGIKEYGEYKGKLELLLAGQPRERAETIDFTVIAELKPSLTALTGSDSVKANVVDCNSNCWLARLLLPASNFQDVYEVSFEKPVAARVDITDKALVVRGDKTQFQLTDAHLTFPLPALSSAPPPAQPGQVSVGNQPQSSSEKRFITVPVTLSRSTLPPDHYSGAIYLSVAGQAANVKVPVDLNVRVGPLLPLLFLIGGILLGKLFKYMQEKGNPQADALVSLNRIRFRLQSAHADDRALIEPMLAQANTFINENHIDQATPLIKLIESRLETLNELRTIEARLAGKQHPKVQEVIDHIRQARELIALQEDAKVKTHTDAISAALVELATTMMGSDNKPDPDILEATERAKTAEAQTNRAAFAAPAPAAPTKMDRIRNGLAWLTGMSDEVRAGATLWLLRPSLWLLLLVALIALGMKSLYVDNPVFGASSFDYLSLVFLGA